ncbi:MAG: restriction endonuclease subunit S [Bacteroidetes bacterium]|nr:restriction endonuclease subunit S [Bacteroidota bacterium]
MREDWEECELGEVCLSSKGKKPPILENKISEIVNVPYINIKAFEKGIIDEYTDGNKCNLCEDGDLLMVWDGARAGLSGKARKGAVGSTLMKIEEVKGIEKQYLSYFLLSLYTKINTNPRGVGIPHVEPRILWYSKLLIVSSPIQRAIVTKIEALFSDLDNGIANFKKAQAQLKIYRQAVLKKAFEGEFTKEWRKKQTNLPTASALLKQIKEERQNHYNQQIEDWKKAVKVWEKNGKKDKKPNKPRKLKELSAFSEDELNEFAELPKNWIWSKVDKIIDHNTHSIKAGPFGSSLKKSFYVESGYKIYGQEQVISGNHKIGNYYVDEIKYQELFSCAVKSKDALISLVGTVGKVLILPDDCEEGIINPRLIKISFNSFYNPEFFKYYFESAYLKSLYAHKSHGATMDIITLGIIQELPFPLFSIKEQNQIIQEIESRLSVCDKMEQSITESILKAEALRQSILKKAFEGKLLSHSEIELCKAAADYEPASELLKKIQADKLSKELEKKKPTVKKKSKK